MPNSGDTAKILADFIARPFPERIQATSFSWIWNEVEPPSLNSYSAMPPDKRDVYAFLKEIFGLFPANPSKQFRRDVFNALYQKQAFGPGEYDRLSDRLKDYVREGKRCIAIVGQRGAGKTSFLNMWLHENTHEFLDREQKTLWFRVDASKLYNSQYTDVEKYFKVHAVYVFLVYSSDKIDFDAVRNETFYDLLNQPGLRGEHYRRILDFIRKKWSRAPDRYSSDDRSVTIVKEILSNQELTQTCLAYYKKLFEHAVKRGYKFLAIIDGVDNLSASQDDRRYTDMCAAIRHFLFGLKELLAYRCLVLTRPETIHTLHIDVIGHNHLASKDEVPFSFFAINLPRASIERIVEKKLLGMNSDALKGHRDRLAETARRRGGDESAVREAINYGYLSRSIAQYSSELTVALQKVLKGVPKDDNFLVGSDTEIVLLETLFAGDIRAYFRALRQGIMLREYFASVNIPNAGSSHIMLEIFLLCGAFYKVTRHQPGADNARRNAMDVQADRQIEESEPEWAPNIFWYDYEGAAADKVHRWHGLSGLRLLQLLNARPMIREHIVAVLKGLFDYSESVLHEQIDAFHAFGLIHAVPTVAQVSSEGVNSKYDIIYKTTKKGRTIATLSLYYLKWQYFLALDTPMYNAFARERRADTFLKLYRNPNNLGESDWHYFDAAVSTCATFLRDFYNAYTEEAAMLTEAPRIKGVQAFFSGDAVVKNVFALPDNYWSDVQSLTAKLIRAREKSSRRRQTRFQDFIAQVKGNFAEL